MRPQSATSGLRGPPLSICDIMLRGYLPQVPLLVNLGVNLEARDASGRTPLMLAAYVQPEDWGVGIARLLIEEGVRIDPRDKHGMNALHHACVYERVELATVLLNAPDFDLMQCDKFGNTALHYAAMAGNANLVRLLVSYHHKYRHPLTKTNKQGRTAKEEAFRNGRLVCAAILEEEESPKPTATQKKDRKQSKESITGPTSSLSKEIIGDNDATSGEKEDCTMVIAGGGEETKQDSTKAGDDVTSLGHADDDTGGLFPSGGLVSSSYVFGDGEGEAGPARKPPHLHLQASPQISERSFEGSRSPRQQRRSAGNRPRLGSGRRNSNGSTSSSRSGASARKQPLLSNNHYHNNSSANIDNPGVSDHHHHQHTPTTPTIKSDVSEAELTQAADVTNKRQDGALPRGSPMLRRTNSALTIASKNDENVDPTLQQPSQSLHTTNAASQRPPSGRKISLTRSDMSSTRPETAGGTFLTATYMETATTKRPRSLYSTSSNASRAPPMPNEKNPEQVIHVASDTDFRNSPEYVLKLTRMEWSPAHMQTDALPVLIRPPSCPQPPTYDDDRARQKPTLNGSWRDNMRFLYRHYEYQCSPSWRNAAVQTSDTSAFMNYFGSYYSQDDTEDGKDKKPRRPSSSQRPGSLNELSTSGNVKRRPASSLKQRKGSNINSPMSPSYGGDSGTASSGDSSVGQGSRKRSEIRVPDPAVVRQ